jgi:carbonic anhydrase
MTVTDDLLQNSKLHASTFDNGSLPVRPRKGVTVLACMDGRVNPYAVLGLEEGDAHMLRNAGGVVTDDAIRSLAISQHLLGTTEIILIHHTECGMLTFTDEQFQHKLEQEAGARPTWAVETFTDLDEDVRESIARIKSSPFIPRKDSVRGFVYDVKDGSLREVVSRAAVRCAQGMPEDR